jgi:hypothetical protein
LMLIGGHRHLAGAHHSPLSGAPVQRRKETVRGETVKLTFVHTASEEKAVVRRQLDLSGDVLLSVLAGNSRLTVFSPCRVKPSELG